MSTDTVQCQALTRAGRQCKNTAPAGADYCHIHQQSMGTAPVAGAPEDPADFARLVTEINELARKLQQLVPNYQPPPFSPEALRRLLRENAERLSPAMRAQMLRDLGANLPAPTPRELLDVDTWKGMFYIMNHMARTESRSVVGNITGRIASLPGMGLLSSLPGASVVTEMSSMLAGSDPKDFMDIDTWKGMWFILNYSLQHEAGEIKRRVRGDQDTAPDAEE